MFWKELTVPDVCKYQCILSVTQLLVVIWILFNARLYNANLLIGNHILAILKWLFVYSMKRGSMFGLSHHTVRFHRVMVYVRI